MALYYKYNAAIKPSKSKSSAMTVVALPNKDTIATPAVDSNTDLQTTDTIVTQSGVELTVIEENAKQAIDL